uniref:Eukaryotic translation initiation factor 3 subunit G N-terminal domain-containing protein n=1 Tax=Tanacetum cinerariifolium TaxID=118510 RepID=A0A6L2NUW8_TANCI|nr:hypothetical protein [Tanacetum cinerariifolium]
MTETMEQYMSKTHEDYGLGVTRPSISQDTLFELKGQFLKELYDNTFSGSEHENANEHIEKVLEIVDLFHILKVTQDQIMLRAFPEVILFYNGFDVPTRQILDSKGAIPSKTVADAKIAIQEMAKYFQKLHNGTSLKTRSTKTSDRLAANQAKLNNLDREIKKVNEKVYAAQVECEHCKGPHYSKDCPLKEEGKTLEEACYTKFGLPFQPGRQYRAAEPEFDQHNNGNFSYPPRKDTMEESLKIKQPRGIAENVLVRIGKFIFPIDFIILDIPEDDDVSLILRGPFLSTAHVKIDVFKRKVTLRVREEKLVFESINPASSMIKKKKSSKGKLAGRMMIVKTVNYIEIYDVLLAKKGKLKIKIGDITTYFVKVCKVQDVREVDCYGNANLGDITTYFVKVCKVQDVREVDCYGNANLGEGVFFEKRGEECGFDSKDEVVPKVEEVSLVNGVFDGALGGDGDEDFAIGDGEGEEEEEDEKHDEDDEENEEDDLY